ncbi:MAG: signal peptidase II [Clostridium sp.]|nr:signal peptidase II [Clostridium sp.]MCM1444653.1 signal peptidase II [Candidatus Amulumruptor caecigallinarius]
MKKTLTLSLVIILVDQIIKLIITNTISIYQNIDIIKNLLSLTYVQNKGAAFSILNGNTIFLILISIFALVFIYIYLIKGKSLNKVEIILYSLLIGGILGNLIDRIFRGFVIDYISVNIFGYKFPIFNFADICIVISVIVLVIFEFIGEKKCNIK